MKRVKNIIIIVLVLILKLNNLFAQNYPVQITTILNPPFSGYLPDYGSIGNQNLKLIILFNDFSKPSYTVKLKFKLSGQNINLQSKNFYYEGPFTLVPGVPLEISGSEITGLLNSNNLDFTGFSKQQYETSKVLPEGLYTLCFTAYDFNNPTPIQVSNQGCFSAWMMLNDPPFLNIPFCGNVQPVTTPQNIIFQWTSMNLVSPNSANNTTYEFSLYEIRPKGGNPFNVIQTLQPIYQTTTGITTLNYGLTEPVLNVGMDYVWRVKAIDLTGRDLFKNQGYSQHCTFTYGSMTQFIDSSAIALNLQGVALNYRLAKCFWDTFSVYKNYRIYYRKQNTTNWFTNSNITRSYNFLQNLEAGSTYEAYIKGTLLDNGEGPASNTITINTPQKTDYFCGQSPSPPPTLSKPLLAGGTGQMWEIGQVEMIVTRLSNLASPIGQYSGYGKVAVPFLGNANFNVKFNNITVNEEFKIIAGRVDVITEGIGNWLNHHHNYPDYDSSYYYNGSIDSVKTNGDGSITIFGSNGPTTLSQGSYNGGILITASNGTQWVVGSNGDSVPVTGGATLPPATVPLSADEMDIIKKALALVRNEYSNNAVNNLKTNRDQKKLDAKNAADNKLQSLNVNPNNFNNQNTEDVFFAGTSTPANLSNELTSQKNSLYKEADEEYYVGAVAQIFGKENNSDKERTIIGNYLYIGSTLFKQYVTEQKQLNKTNQQIAVDVKENGIIVLIKNVVAKKMKYEKAN